MSHIVQFDFRLVAEAGWDNHAIGEIMARRRRRRDSFDDTMGLVQAIVALVFGFALLVVFVPGLAQAIFGVIVLVLVVVVGGGLVVALLFVIGKTLLSRQKSAKLDTQIA